MIMRWNGFNWSPPAGMTPALLYAYDTQTVNTTPTGRLLHDHWILDVNGTPGERVRVGAADAPWQERPADVAHLYPPGCPYWEAPAGPRFSVQCLFIGFRDAGALGLERLLDPYTRYARVLDPDRLLADRLARIAVLGMTEREAGYWAAQALFFEIVALLGRTEPVDSPTWRLTAGPPAEYTSDFVQIVRQYLHAHLSDAVTLAEIAEHLGVSPSTLSHRFRAETGEAPMATLQRLRIDLAKVLLARGYPLKEVARQTGFCDAFYLSKVFKRQEGLTPRAYRARRVD
jgi:AraC-like DNA-binding protein